MTITVGRLWHHPVKSMRGYRVDEIVLGPGGVLGDRAYGFVDVATERLVSAKHPKRYGALLSCAARFVEPPRVDEPIPAVGVTFPGGETITGDRERIAERVGELLGHEVRMVTSVPPGVPYEEVWPEVEGYGPAEFYGALQVTSARDDPEGERILAIPTGMAAQGTLLDLAAMHVLAASTLAALAAEHPDGVWDERRFRPNIVFADEPGDGGPADGYAEDGWMGRDLLIGERARVHIVAPTPRCPMPTLEQDELPEDKEILRTVARVNRRRLGELGQFACAGAYAEVVTPGVVRVGDPVRVSESVAESSALADAMAMIRAGLRAASGAR